MSFPSIMFVAGFYSSMGISDPESEWYSCLSHIVLAYSFNSQFELINSTFNCLSCHYR